MKYLSDAFIGSYVIVIDIWGHSFYMKQRLQIVRVDNTIYYCTDVKGETQGLRKRRIRICSRKELE